ncbi:glycoside hydrolase family 36 protein [Baudoinia panamericana UAMH 10762]|uniref:Glycoside hydrolase family 36 protein n=1 Tax=Baudoinia panamericana (strain UAMH 10762) TaxID=717646 RepID=M2LJW0_BAUPA|nr:glycoside hydrolase family 36 protein [Baudoinia panamericana UAMH 10762]EMC94492.1 glycoside hydrolase family 36 protein [Baudoinia panamericana UAMH 10762]
MYAKITCDPPLGQASQIARSRGSVRFTVLLETSTPSLLEDADEQPAICLWHNHRGVYDWSELTLEPTKSMHEVLLLNRPNDRSLTRSWFTAELPGLPKNAQIVSFTVKFRLSTAKGWRWVKDSTGTEDGELHYHGSSSLNLRASSKLALTEFFDNMSPDIKIKNEQPDTDDTLLYSLTCPVQGASDPDSGYQHHRLGTPRHSSRWFALIRLWSPWLAPRQGQGNLRLDKDAVLLSFLRDDGLHVVCLAISGVEDVTTTFPSHAEGEVVIRGRNDRTSTGTSRVLVAVAESFEVANAAVFYHSRKVMITLGATNADAETKTLMDGEVKPEWLEEWYDGLTYCTWNGLGQDLTSDKIYHALDELSQHNINITNLIIDDNWQSLSHADTQFHRGWLDFEANKEGFPDGLKKTTSEIRTRHPNVNHIAVWHAILGYWGGVSPEGGLAKRYRTIEVQKEAGVAGGKFTVVHPDDAKQMYDDFYRFLSSSGVDSVKTDAQFFLDLLLHAPDRRTMTTQYQDAWTLAHLRHFSSRAISCMSQTPAIMFHSQLPHNKPRLLVRNSDDFFPEVPASHPWHIFCNAHNSLFTQHLNVLPDWDMFQTSHSWAGFHAAARCVSGGPIYFTDAPGKHDIALIRQMTAQTPRGKTVILRPSVVGRSTDPYNGYESQALLKVGTYSGGARKGTGILGIFNVSGTHLSEFVGLSAIPGTEEGEYIVASFQGERISPPMTRGGPRAMVGVELEVQGWDILSAYPLHRLEVKGAAVRVALLGLLGKMTGCAAMTGYEIKVESNGRLRIWTSLKALGVMGLWIEDLGKRNIEEQFMVLIFGKPIGVGCVRVSDMSEKVLEIDVEKAWRESGERAGWSNEVGIEVFMG